MRFWRYGMIRNNFRSSATRRSMSHAASQVVKKSPLDFITPRAARMMFVGSASLVAVTTVVTECLLNYQSYLDHKEHLEYMEKKLKQS